MNTFRQHFPSYMDVKAESFEFETEDELLKHMFLKQWSNQKDFYRFSLSGENIMAEYKIGVEYYVAGTVENTNNFSLPKWEWNKIKNEI